MADAIRIEGTDDLVRALRGLTDAVRGKEIRKAALQAVRPVRDDARRRVRRKSGRLARAIGTRSKITGPYSAEADVGFDKRRAWYGGQVELGHKLVRGKKKRNKRVIGHVPAYPFLRPALESQAPQAEARMREVLRRNIERLVNRGR